LERGGSRAIGSRLARILTSYGSASGFGPTCGDAAGGPSARRFTGPTEWLLVEYSSRRVSAENASQCRGRASRSPGSKMAEYVCDRCGEVNPVGTVFCVNCHAFLAWDQVEREERLAGEGAGVGRSGESGPPSEQNVETRAIPQIRVPATAARSETEAGAARQQSVPTDPAEGLFRITADQREVIVPATGEPVGFPLSVMNTSAIVDGYVVEAPGAPEWLQLDPSQVRLLPGSEDALPARLRASATTLVPAQQLQVTLRIRSMSQAPAHVDLPILVTVPVVDVPVRLDPEPSLLRVRDGDTAQCTVFVDNSSSNRPVHLRFIGSDPELAVAFRFDPSGLEVAPGASGSVRVSMTAAGPEPGQEISRQLTVTALDGGRRVDTAITFQQFTSARIEDPMITLEAEPSLVRVRDSTVGMARVVADNRRGRNWADVQLRASDPEQLVRVSWHTPGLRVPPGGTAQTEVRFEAPQPDAGTEVRRTVTLTATDGRRTTTASVTFVQVASASPMSTLAVHIEPSIVRVQDADGATLQVLVDNRRGHAGVRIFLDGSDPERAIRATFSPPVVDLGPGQARAVSLRLDSWRPPPGQELTRQFTVTASDGYTSVDASGSLVQISSRAAIESLGVRLDPSVLRLSGRRGVLRAMIDNRNGAQPVRVAMRGDDPENIVHFTFAPAMIDVPAGQVGSTTVTFTAPRAPAGQQVTRPFAIMASDGRAEVQADGSLIQSSAERRPFARVLLTLLGGLAMIIGAFLPWRTVSELRGVDLNADTFMQVFGVGLNLAGFERLIAVGVAILALAALMIFGLTGRSGRLSRLSALLAAALVVGTFVTFAIAGRDIGPAPGAILVLAGCITGYIGGLLARR
jgi:hypothetical protein